MVRIVVLASFNMDLVMRAERQPRPGETLQGEFAMYLGGKGFNQAIAARRLGADVSAIGRVGDDAFGRAFLDALDREGIDRRCVTVNSDEGTGVASIVVGPDGENAIVQAPRANRQATYRAFASVAAPHTRFQPAIPAVLVDCDAFLATLETPPDAALQMVTDLATADAHDDARGSPRTRWSIVNLAPASLVTRETDFGRVRVANAAEAAAATGLACGTIDEAAEAARRLGGVGVVTLGARGAVAVAHGQYLYAGAPDVPVVDTTGAGDAFCAALGVRLAEGVDLPDAVRFACAAGALACTRAGAEPSMPWRAEVDALEERGRRA